MREVELAIRASADVDAATRGMDKIGQSSKDMANDVERASKDADRSLDGVGDAVDGTASTASTLAGAFGDVAGGLGLIGLGGFSDELESLAPALMLAAGAADIASVAMKAGSLAKIKDTAATVANKTASIASSAAAKAQAAAQWALNAAMAANPVLLVVLAVVALVAIFVVLYKRSSTVREIVNKVGEALKTAGKWILDTSKKVGGFLLKWNPLTVQIRIARTAIGLVVDKVRDLARWAGDKVPPKLEAMKKTAGTVGRWLKNTFVGFVEAVVAPFKALWQAIEKVIDWLGKIKVPAALEKIGDLVGKIPGVGRAVAPGAAAPATSGTASGGVLNLTLNVNGVLTEDQAAKKIQSVLNTRNRLLRGMVIVQP